MSTCLSHPPQEPHNPASWIAGRVDFPGTQNQPVVSGHQGWGNLCLHLETHNYEVPGHMLGNSWEPFLHSHRLPGQGTLDARTCLQGTRHRNSLHALPHPPWVASGSHSQALGHGDAHRQAPAEAMGVQASLGGGEACQPRWTNPLQPLSLVAVHTGLRWAVPSSPHRQGMGIKQALRGPPGSPPPGSLLGGSQSLHWLVFPAQVHRGMALQTVTCRGASSPQRLLCRPGGVPHSPHRVVVVSLGFPQVGSSPHLGPRKAPGSPDGRSSGD